MLCFRLSNQTIMKCCTGLSIDLLLKIQQFLNFDVDLYEVEDFQWGNKVCIPVPNTGHCFQLQTLGVGVVQW